MLTQSVVATEPTTRPAARPWLTPNQAAIEADVTPATVRRWCAARPGLARRVMGRWRVDPDALARLLAGGCADAR